MFSKLKKNRGKVIVKFLIIFLILFILSKILPLHLLEITTAKSVAFFLNIVGTNAQIQKNIITYNNTKYIIVRECTGIESIIMLISVILADNKLKRKKQILIIGIPILYIWNILRVGISILIGIEFGHFLLWMISVLIILGLISYGYEDIAARIWKKNFGKRKYNEHRIRNSGYKKQKPGRKNKNT